MKKIEVNSIPLIISILLIAVSIVIMMTSNYILSREHYIGMGCIVIALVLYIIHRKSYSYFFLATLFIGLIGYLDIYITSYKIGIAGVGINPIFLGLLFLLLVLDKELKDKIMPNN
ncbi:hypothetical protein M3P19_09455 [Muricauda sp. 2012CJ35-5]|uniref:Uncharacterized protein n=1 Tax=Flagellimonas spongiicola TaxID=2942208 RepID=A0ABT0PSP9_9FLAO|nr:hypothetical protein [Allomuricauda spongiicola]MCL6274236.1 hypothetical protein [Allomuricauda spongiicola]